MDASKLKTKKGIAAILALVAAIITAVVVFLNTGKVEPAPILEKGNDVIEVMNEQDAKAESDEEKQPEDSVSE